MTVDALRNLSLNEANLALSTLSHAVLSHHGRTVAAAQLRIVRFPFLKGGAAYLNWGPLWRVRDIPADPGHLRNMLRALRNEYVIMRRLSLRILPKIFMAPDTEGLTRLFADEGYVRRPDPLRTFVVDLRPSLEDIRQNLHKSWKGSLKFAEKQDLEVIEVLSDNDLATVAAINREMKERKQYLGSDIPQLIEAHKDLPESLKLKILLGRFDGEAVAALGWSAIGKMSFPIVGGTGDKALGLKASFLLFWRMVQRSKESGCLSCDLAGVNEKRNPGGYFFKKGLAGKDARESTYLGLFDAYLNLPAYLLFKAAMTTRESLRNAAKKAASWKRGRR